MLPVDTIHRVCEFLHDARLLRSVCRSWAASLRPMWWDGGFRNSSAVGLQPFVQRLLDDIPRATHVTLRLGRSVSCTAEAIILYNLSLCIPAHQIETLRLHLLCDGRVGEIQLHALQTIVENVASPTLQRLALHVNHRYMCRIQRFVRKHTSASDAYAHIATILSDGIHGSSRLTDLALALDVAGDWAIRALIRVIHAGLDLKALRLHAACCQEQTVHGIQQLATSLVQPSYFSQNRLSVLDLDVSRSQLDVSTGRFLVHAVRRMVHLTRLSLNLSHNPSIGNFSLFRGTNIQEGDAPLVHLTVKLNHCAMGRHGFRQWMNNLGDVGLWPNRLQTLSFHCTDNHIGDEGLGDRTIPFPMEHPGATHLLVDVRNNGTTLQRLHDWVADAKSHRPNVHVVLRTK